MNPLDTFTQIVQDKNAAVIKDSSNNVIQKHPKKVRAKAKNTATVLKDRTNIGNQKHSKKSNAEAKNAAYVVQDSFTIVNQMDSKKLNTKAQNETGIPIDPSITKNLKLLTDEETKLFIESLVSIYGNETFKCKRKNLKSDTVTLLQSNYSFDHEQKVDKYRLTATYNFTNSTLIFKSQFLQSDTNVYMYNGINRKMYSLFKNRFTSEKSENQNVGLKSEMYDINIIFSPLNKNHFRRNYNRIWRTYNRPNRITIGSSISYNMNTGFLNAVDFSEETQQNIDNRLKTRRVLFEPGIGFNVGYAKRSHSILATYTNTVYGFIVKTKEKIDWPTGYSVNDALIKDSVNSLHAYQFGLQYKYSRYKKMVSPYFAVGINLVFSKDSNTKIPIQTRGYFGTNVNLGLGLNIHPTYCCDIHIAPIANLFLNSVQGTKINTRFFSTGIEIGMTFNIGLKRI